AQRQSTWSRLGCPWRRTTQSGPAWTPGRSGGRRDDPRGRPLLPAQQVEGGAGAEPGDLLVVQGVLEGDRLDGAVRLMQDGGNRDPGGEVAQVGQGDAVPLAHPVVVGRVGEDERKDTLLLQIAFVDAREGARDDRRAAEVARR